MNYLLLLGVWLYPRLEVEPPNLFPYRAIYLYPFAAVKFKEYLPYIRDSEINCVVVDFKSAEGYVTYNSNIPFAKKIGAELPIINLENLIRICKEEGLRLVGRIVVFQDGILARYDGGRYSIKGLECSSALDRKVWVDGHGLYWVDPCLEEVRKYNIAVAKDLVSRGVPEVQFDYIRFPSATGKFKPYINKCGNKREVIAGFLRDAKEELKPFGAQISGDVFGCVLWIPTLLQEGQSLEAMAPFLDVICPMLYPSHFSQDYARSIDPKEQAYNLIFGSVEKGINLLGESRFVPYIQGFDYMTRGTFGPEYIARQIRAVQDSPAWGYIIWHAASRYGPLWELLGSGELLSFNKRPTTIEGRIRELLDVEVRPFLELQGGDVKFVGIKDGVVKVRLADGCKRSPLEYQFYLEWIETRIKEKIAEVKEVEGV